MKQLYIYGASGHGLVLADIAQACGYEQIDFIDDGDNTYLRFDEIKNKSSIPMALGIGNNHTRSILYTKLKAQGFSFPALIHPSAIISKTAKIEEGTVVMPGVIINAASRIGIGAILNSGCIIEHECSIGNFAHISPGVSLAGNVCIGEFTHIGIGSNCIQGIVVGHHSIIGASSNLVKNIADFKKAYGNPCVEIENLKNE